MKLTKREALLLVEALLLLRNVAQLPKKGRRNAQHIGRNEVDALLLRMIVEQNRPEGEPST